MISLPASDSPGMCFHPRKQGAQKVPNQDQTRDRHAKNDLPLPKTAISQRILVLVITVESSAKAVVCNFNDPDDTFSRWILEFWNEFSKKK